MLIHWDDASRSEREKGHLRGTWTLLGEAAGCIGVGLRRIELPTDGWSTPAHVHGTEEEIFYVLAGSGLSWHDGLTHEVGPGDCIVHRSNEGPHTFHSASGIDLLAFGQRAPEEGSHLPRAGVSWLGPSWVPAGGDHPHEREASAGPPELPATPSPRPATIVNLEDVEIDEDDRGTIAWVNRNLGKAAGSVKTGLRHEFVPAGKLGCPPHCHAAEEEIFVVLDGTGTLLLGDEEHEVRPGHVVSRPPGTGVAHAFRGGPDGITYLAYGTREPNDIVYYPRSNKIFFCGVNLIARVEKLDYWDGED
ncbi:MAG: cupin domain-containing protein [Gaiellaceae bacterium]